MNNPSNFSNQITLVLKPMRERMKLPISFGIVMSIVTLLFGCSFPKEKISPDVKLAREITVHTAKKLKEQKHLYLIGTGGQMMDDIEMLMMGFYFYDVVDIENARQLLVYSVEQYLSAINTNEEIRPYLYNYPFRTENVEIVIYFRNPNGSNVPSDKITIAAAKRGKIIYYIDCPEKYNLKTLYEETYEEALKLVSK
jgi:hypothetical protein